MEDPGKVVTALGFFATVAIIVTAIVRAAVANRKEARVDTSSSPSTEARLARIEQAVDAIALEVERISEGQRFTTKLLSEQALPAPKSAARQVSSNTPI